MTHRILAPAVVSDVACSSRYTIPPWPERFGKWHTPWQEAGAAFVLDDCHIVQAHPFAVTKGSVDFLRSANPISGPESFRIRRLCFGISHPASHTERPSWLFCQGCRLA